MSQAALDIYNQQRAFQIANGPFSLDGVIDGVTTIGGIFDNSYKNGSDGPGNMPRQSQFKRFMIAEIPSGIIPRTSKIVIDSKEYLITKADIDEEGIPNLWLQS